MSKNYIVAIRAKVTDVKKVLRNVSRLKHHYQYLENAANELGYPTTKARKGRIEIYFMTEDQLNDLTEEMIAYYITTYDVDVTPLVAVDADVYYSIIKDVRGDDSVDSYKKQREINNLILPHVKVVNKEQKTVRKTNPNKRPKFQGTNPYKVGDLVIDTNYGHCYEVTKTTPKGYTLTEFDFDEQANRVECSHYRQRNNVLTVRFGNAKRWYVTTNQATEDEYNYTGMLPKATLKECFDNKQEWLNRIHWD